MKKGAGMTDFEAGAYAVAGLGWFLLIVVTSFPTDDAEAKNNRTICLAIMMVVTIIAVALILKERAWRKKMAMKRLPIPFPKDKFIKSEKSLECIAYFKAGVVGLAELAAIIGLTPPTLDELLVKSGYTDEKLPVKYDTSTQTFTVPPGYVLYVNPRKNIGSCEDCCQDQLVSQVKIVLGEMGTPVTVLTMGQSVDIETLPRLKGIDPLIVENVLITSIENGTLDAEYDPKTQILLIKSGGIQIDGLGNMRMFRISDYKEPLKFKIVKPIQEKASGEEMGGAPTSQIKECTSCKIKITGQGDFCPNCGGKVESF